MDQVFAVRQVCKKYLANGKDVFWAFMHLEKAYDTIDRHGMLQMQHTMLHRMQHGGKLLKAVQSPYTLHTLRVYGVGGKLLKEVQIFYVDSRGCVRVGNDVREWFPGNVGLRQGCVMSPWLFNVYVYGWCGSRGKY